MECRTAHGEQLIHGDSRTRMPPLIAYCWAIVIDLDILKPFEARSKD